MAAYVARHDRTWIAATAAGSDDLAGRISTGPSGEKRRRLAYRLV
jgi:hypothetical protein